MWPGHGNVSVNDRCWLCINHDDCSGGFVFCSEAQCWHSGKPAVLWTLVSINRVTPLPQCCNFEYQFDGRCRR